METAEQYFADKSRHFNVDILKKYVNGDQASVVHLTGLLIKQLSCSVESLKLYIQSEDLHEIKQLGHKLNGTAQISGLPGISKISSALEELQFFDPAEIESLVMSLDKEIKIVLLLIG